MNDKLYYQQEGSGAIRAWALGAMLEGAGWAVTGIIGFAAIYGLIWLVGQFLPEQSKQAPPPNVTGALVQPLTVETA
jgi:hypothetical protein